MIAESNLFSRLSYTWSNKLIPTVLFHQSSAHKSQQLSRSRGQRQLRDISNIDNELNTIEDMDDMRRMKSFVQTDNEKVIVTIRSRPECVIRPN